VNVAGKIVTAILMACTVVQQTPAALRYEECSPLRVASLGWYRYSSAFSCRLIWLSLSLVCSYHSLTQLLLSRSLSIKQPTGGNQDTASQTTAYSAKPRSTTQFTLAMCVQRVRTCPNCDVNDPRTAQKIGKIEQCVAAQKAKVPQCQNVANKTLSRELCTRHAGEDRRFKESITPEYIRRTDNKVPQDKMFYAPAPLPAATAYPYAAPGSSRGYPTYVPEPPVQRYDGPPMVDARTGNPGRL